jgi:AcrR family transcriptional regulator
MTSLQQKKSAFTKNLLLQAAVDLANTIDVAELSYKKVAEHAGISERTMFRHFSSREAFLDALATLLHQQLELPGIPESAKALSAYSRQLYQQLDKQPRKVEVLLSADLLPRILQTSSKERLKELQALLKQTYPHCPDDLIIKTAANLRYVLSASSWRYYRFYFEFDLTTSIQCADMLVKQSLALLDMIGASSYVEN